MNSSPLSFYPTSPVKSRLFDIILYDIAIFNLIIITLWQSGKFQYIMDVLVPESIIAMLCKRFAIDRDKVHLTSMT